MRKGARAGQHKVKTQESTQGCTHFKRISSMAQGRTQGSASCRRTHASRSLAKVTSNDSQDRKGLQGKAARATLRGEPPTVEPPQQQMQSNAVFGEIHAHLIEMPVESCSQRVGSHVGVVFKATSAGYVGVLQRQEQGMWDNTERNTVCPTVTHSLPNGHTQGASDWGITWKALGVGFVCLLLLLPPTS